MELEYKWKMPCDCGSREFADKIIRNPFMRGLCSSEEISEYDTKYYDTSDGILRNRHKAALRIRNEGGKSIVCLKLPKEKKSGFAAREEYEVEAFSVYDGLAILPEKGASVCLCTEIASLPLEIIARTVFVRHSFNVLINKDSALCTEKKDFCLATLVFDSGIAEKHGKIILSAPISEIELEFKDGNLEIFHEWAGQFEKRFSLMPLSTSKLAQALAII